MSVFGIPVYGPAGEIELRRGGALDDLTRKSWIIIQRHLNDTTDFGCQARLNVIKKGSQGPVTENMFISLLAPTVDEMQGVNVIFSTERENLSAEASLMHGRGLGFQVDETCVRNTIRSALQRQRPEWLDVKFVILDAEQVADYAQVGLVAVAGEPFFHRTRAV